MTGQGMKAFFTAVEEAREEYETWVIFSVSIYPYCVPSIPWAGKKLNEREYRPEIDRLAAERKERVEKDKKEQMERLMRDMSMDGGKVEGRNRSEQGKGNPFGPHARNERHDR